MIASFAIDLETGKSERLYPRDDWLSASHQRAYSMHLDEVLKNCTDDAYRVAEVMQSCPTEVSFKVANGSESTVITIASETPNALKVTTPEHMTQTVLHELQKTEHWLGGIRPISPNVRQAPAFCGCLSLVRVDRTCHACRKDGCKQCMEIVDIGNNTKSPQCKDEDDCVPANRVTPPPPRVYLGMDYALKRGGRVVGRGRAISAKVKP